MHSLHSQSFKSLFCLLLVLLLPLGAFSQSQWESIVLAENSWSYFEGNSEPDTNWNTLSFDDASWSQGQGGIGYADGDDATTIPQVSSLYLRHSFEVYDLEQIEQLLLDIDYDDGFVAYINGVEVARSSNVSAEHPTYDSGTTIYKEAQMYSGGSAERHQLSMSHLLSGNNVLAIHILNHTATSSDLSAIVYLHAQTSSSTLLYQDTPTWFDAPLTFTSSELPIVKITTTNGDIVDDPKVTAHLGIIDNGVGELNYLTDTFNNYDGYIGIETRGQSSQYFFPKKSYGFETRDADGENNNVNLLGMPKENDWILYAPYSDKSMLRNVVTFELAKALDVYSSRTVFCELFLNDEYQGIYVLMEKIKRDDSRVDIDALMTIPGDDNSLTGGYIFKVDKKDSDYMNLYHGWTTYPSPTYPNAMDITYQYVYPDAEDLLSEERTYLKDHVTNAEKVLISSDYDNKDTGYNKYFNLGSFAEFLLINEVSKEVDKYRYSTYFYKEIDSEGGEIFAGPIWDFNLGYSNVDYWDDGNSTVGWLYSDISTVDYSIMFWWKRLMEDAHFNSIATQRYKQLRAEEWSDANVIYLIDSITSHIYNGQERNYTRWPILGTYVWPNKVWENMTYNDEVAYFQTWILARLAWMDNNMNGADLTPTVEVSISDEVFVSGYKALEVSLSDQYFNHSHPKTKYFDIKGDDGLLSVDSVIYKDASTVVLLITGTVNGEVSVEVDDNVLTGFDDIPSQTINMPSALNPSAELNTVKAYAVNKSIIIETTTPEYLGETLQVFNIQGQQIAIFTLDAAERNEFDIDLTSGVYLLGYTYNGINCTTKISY